MCIMYIYILYIICVYIYMINCFLPLDALLLVILYSSQASVANGSQKFQTRMCERYADPGEYGLESNTCNWDGRYLGCGGLKL